ncbi:MAG: CRP-like cAMP-binding protein [Bradymonadia bacterium]|jgi:CRP-like cAMP-binding protein
MDSLTQLADTAEVTVASRDVDGAIALALRFWDALEDRAGLVVPIALSSELSEWWRLARDVALHEGDLVTAAFAAAHEGEWAPVVRALRDSSPVVTARLPALGTPKSGVSLAAGTEARAVAIKRACFALLQEEPSQIRRRLPLLDDTAQPGAWLERCSVRCIEPGETILDDHHALAWWVSGAIASPMGHRSLPVGALIRRSLPGNVAAASVTSRVLVLTRDDAEELFGLPGIDDSIRRLDARQNVVRALNRCQLYRRLSTRAQGVLIAQSRGVALHDDLILPKGARGSGLFIVASGTVALLDREQTVSVSRGQLGVGDVFGALDDVPEPAEIVAKGPVALLYLKRGIAADLLADEPQASAWLRDLLDQRREDIEQLDTGEVTLLDD